MEITVKIFKKDDKYIFCIDNKMVEPNEILKYIREHNKIQELEDCVKDSSILLYTIVITFNNEGKDNELDIVYTVKISPNNKKDIKEITIENIAKSDTNKVTILTQNVKQDVREVTCIYLLIEIVLVIADDNLTNYIRANEIKDKEIDSEDREDLKELGKKLEIDTPTRTTQQN